MVRINSNQFKKFHSDILIVLLVDIMIIVHKILNFILSGLKFSLTNFRQHVINPKFTNWQTKYFGS